MFLFRPAELKDREAVEKISAKIWDGDDYMPYVFDAWCADPDGEFTMIEFEEKVVGFAKLTFLTPHDAWMEGLRKDPDITVRGVGTALSRHYLRMLKHRKGLHSVRFSTYFGNSQSRILNERLGFEVVRTMSVKSKKYESELNCKDFSLIEQCEANEEVMNFIRASQWFDTYLCDGWRVYPYTEDLLKEKFCTPGTLWGIRENGVLEAVILLRIDCERQHGKILFMDAQTNEHAKELFDFAQYSILEKGYDYCEAIVPMHHSAKQHFADNGFISWEQEEDFLIYEIPLDRVYEN